MSFFFTNAFLIPFTLLITVPLILHLFARTRPPVYKFSSIEFILRILRTTMRIKRPQDWILLLLRTLLFAALVLLFLQPVLFYHRKFAGSFQRRNVVLVVDASASMAYVDGAQTRFASACAEASEIISDLSAGDTANIIWMDSEPDSVFPETGVNMRYLQDTLQRARVTSETGDIEGSLSLAARMLEQKDGSREICIVSDFQATAWKHANAAVPPDVSIVNIRVGTGSGANTALTDIHCYPAMPLVNEECSIYCEVNNFSDQVQRSTVFFAAGENRQTQDVVIPAWNKTTVMFRHRFARGGISPVAVSLSEDSFTGDDRRWKTIRARESLKAGIYANEPGTADIWTRALNAMGWAKTTTLEAGDLEHPIDFDILMLSGWNSAGTENILSALTNGCTILCLPPRNMKPGDGMPLFSALPAGQNPLPAHWEQLDKPKKIKVSREDDDIFRLFAEGDYGDPARGMFKARFKIEQDAFPAENVLMRFDDNVPALVRFRQNGNLFLWNMPLDRELSDWAGQVEFLPFLAELLLASRSEQNAAEEIMYSYPGETIGRGIEEDMLVSDITLADANGSFLDLEERRGETGKNVISATTPPPGLYTWKHLNKTIGCSIVNFPAAESDLRSIPSDDVNKDGSLIVTTGSEIRKLREGIKLWPYLLGAAILLALMESAALLWIERK